MDFNYYDYIFLGALLFSTLLGLSRGFWLQMITLVTWTSAALFYHFFAVAITENFVSHYMALDTANWVVLIVVFAVFFIIGFIVRILTSFILGVNTFTFFNKVMGLLLGFFTGALFVILAIYAVGHSDLHKDSDWQNSIIASQVTKQLSHYDSFSYALRHSHSYSTISENKYTEELA